jgi:hypothetical protein
MVLVAIVLAIAAFDASMADEPPLQPGRRVPWTSSRLVGSPEPSLEYTVERTFKNLALRSPVP